jgi:hypothetical protein
VDQPPIRSRIALYVLLIIIVPIELLDCLGRNELQEIRGFQGCLSEWVQLGQLIVYFCPSYGVTPIRAAEAPEKGDPIAEYRKHAKTVLAAAEADVAAKKLPGIDWSTIDFRVAQAMAKNGFSTTGIAKGIVGGSPQLEERKGRSIAAYGVSLTETAESPTAIKKCAIVLLWQLSLVRK